MKRSTKKSAATKSATTTKKSSTKKSSTKKAAHKNSTAQNAAIARHRLDPQLKIVVKVDGNPRRKGTFGYKSFAKIKNGMTVEQFVEKGGRLRDLHWDLQKGNVATKKSA